MKWWQLKRIWFGFWFIISIIAFGIAQPLLWHYVIETKPPEGVIDISNLLLIVITLFALGLTGFSVLIYESLQERLSTRITQGIKRSRDEVHESITEDLKKVKSEEEAIHEGIEQHLKEVLEREKELSQRTEEEIKNRQNLFRVQMLRSAGFTFWELFMVWEKVKENKVNHDIHAKNISEDLIRIAIRRSNNSLRYSKKLPEDEYKNDIFRCKNNWAYFLAEAARIKDVRVTEEDKEKALNFVNEILAVVSKQDFPEDYFEFQESCAWVLHHLSEKDDKLSKQKAKEIISELLEDASIKRAWQKEKEKKWANILKKGI